MKSKNASEKTPVTPIRIDKDVKRKLKGMAKVCKIDFSKYVNKVLAQHVN